MNDVVLTQTEDHFFTDEFKETHPHKIVNEFYQKNKDTPDVINMQLDLNEIDNYNPGAQARLAKYMALDI